MQRIQLRVMVIGVLVAVAGGTAACDGADPFGPGSTELLSSAATNAAAHVSPPASPVTMTFDKVFMPAQGSETFLVWHGTATLGGVSAPLVSSIDLTLPGTRWAGPTLYATVRWEVTGDLETVIETVGVVNFNNGIVRTNGQVVSGPYAGSRVHQQGQLVGLDASGFLRIHPATGS
jgi:hypothetical protein